MKLKSNVWIRQTEPEPDSTQSPDSSVYYYFTHQGSLKAGYANTSQEVVGTQHEHDDLDAHPPLPPSISHDMVQRETVKVETREKIIKSEIEKERIREQIIMSVKEQIREKITETEIEKERIREQIIMSEIAKRRALEDEIRHDLKLLDAELARRRESRAMLLGLPPVSNPLELFVKGPIRQGRSVDEGVSYPLDKKETLNVVKCVSQGFENLPIQEEDEDLIISEVNHMPDTEKGKEEEKTVLLAKPGVNISGSKRKAVTSPVADTSKCPSGNILNKKAKGEWSCDLFAANPPSESSPNLHLQGKKHIVKEATLKSQLAGKNYDAGLLPKSPSIEKEIAVDSSLLKKNEDSSAKMNQDSSQLLKHDNIKKIQVETVQERKTNCDPKKPNYKYWCEMCQVGGMSENVKYTHEKGKKHLKRLKRSQNCETGTCNKKKKIEVDATCFQEVAKDWKDIIKPRFKMNLDADSIEEGEIVDGVES